MKKKEPVIFTGKDIIDLYPYYSYSRQFEGMSLVLKNNRKPNGERISVRIPDHVINTILLNYLKRRKSIKATMAIRHAYVEG